MDANGAQHHGDDVTPADRSGEVNDDRLPERRGKVRIFLGSRVARPPDSRVARPLGSRTASSYKTKGRWFRRSRNAN